MRTFRPSAGEAARRLARPSALALLTVAASGAALAPSAQALDTTHSCTFPYVDQQPVTASSSAGPVGTPISGGPFDLRVAVSSTWGENLGAALSAVGVRSADVSTGISIGGPVKASPFQPLPASGVIVSPTFEFAGLTAPTNHYPLTIGLSSLGFTLIVKGTDGVPIAYESGAPDSDGNPTTIDVPCSFVPPTQARTLTTIIGSDPRPPTPTPSPTPPPTPTPTPFVLTPPTPHVDPTPTPTPHVDPTLTPTPEPTPFITLPVTPTPTPTLGPCNPIALRYQYGVTGTASIKTLTKGSVPLSGETTLSSFCSAPGSLPLSGPITFAPASGNLTALGFLPVSAKVELVATEPLKGSLSVSAPGTNALTVSTKIRIKLPSVKVLGIELAGGANCQSKQVSALTLKSTQGSFSAVDGGPVAGTFEISDLTGCGFLTGAVSPLTKGGGNAIALNLLKK